MKNGKQIMTVVYIPFANPPVLIFCYHIKACQYPDILFPQVLFPVVITPYANNILVHLN